jgi:tetratricopeptide (TPR) repeat protein
MSRLRKRLSPRSPAIDAGLQHALEALSAGRSTVAVLAALDAMAPRHASSADFQAVRACALARMGRFGPVLGLPDEAILDALSVSALEAAGTALVLARRPERAEPYFRRALSLAPDSVTAAINFAATLRFLARVPEAETVCEDAIERSPDAFDAIKMRSDLRRQTTDRNHVLDLQRRLNTHGLPPRGEVLLAYALGKECEDLGQYDDAFAGFARGARVRRANMRYDVREDLGVMSAIGEVFAQSGSSLEAGAIDPAPIFILGLPRSGSTLLDRMLSRHPDVESLDEPQAFGMEVIRLVSEVGRPITRRAFVEASAQLDRERLGRAYLGAIAPLRTLRSRFIDKLPLNFLYVGLIATALPQATIVHIRRDPLDVGVAMFKTLFEEAYPFSYALDEIGAYHRAYRQLMARWSECFGERILHVDYEDLVLAPEPALRRILARAGLDWNPQCLEPHLHARPALTASTLQVREPTHANAVGSWRRYERHLAALRESL